MKLRYLLVAALAALLPAGCHEDDTVITVVVVPSPLGVSSVGGIAYAGDGSAVGNGGNGGIIVITTSQNISIGGPTRAPEPPTPPSPPTTGTILTAADLMMDVSQPGNLIINSTLTITNGGSPRTITATSGDLVVSGFLIAEDPGVGATNGITLSAPNGTVYVTGVVSTVNSDGTPDGDDAGAITISGARVVLTGALQTYGEDHTAGNGGNGGQISVTATGVGDLFFTSGSVIASGGTAVAGPGGTGTGGDVNLTAAGKIHAYGTAISRGGGVTGSVGGETAGDAGTFTLTGGTAVDFNGTLDASGGSVTTSGAGATGGAAGAINFDAPVLRVYGRITHDGGSAVATTGPGIAAGNSTIINLGLGNTADAELGLGTYVLNGGDGAALGGSSGGLNAVAQNGSIVFGSKVVARGGNGIGVGPASGGMGGGFGLIITASPAGSEDPIDLLERSSVDNSGGKGVGGGTGGNGNGMILSSSGDIRCLASLTGLGGDSDTGTAGDGSNVTITVNTLGDLTVEGPITASGGDSGAAGGGGGVIMIMNNAITGSLQCHADILSNGGTSGTGPGAAPSFCGISCANGNLFLSGTHQFRGGDSAAGPTGGGAYSVYTTTAGSIYSSAAIDTGGGGSTAGSATNLAGAPAGNVSFSVGGTDGLITLQSGSIISADGGASTGTSTAGAGGTLSITTLDQAVSISGTISVRGGPANGSGGTGGAGGSVVVDSDSNGAATPGGDITLELGATIDASGGNGTTQGNALSDVTPASVMVGAAAVDFDADSGTNKVAGGRISQLGTIFATGGAYGGDVRFDGHDPAGNDVPVAGPQTLTGTSPGDFLGF